MQSGLMIAPGLEDTSTRVVSGQAVQPLSHLCPLSCFTVYLETKSMIMYSTRTSVLLRLMTAVLFLKRGFAPRVSNLSERKFGGFSSDILIRPRSMVRVHPGPLTFLALADCWRYRAVAAHLRLFSLEARVPNMVSVRTDTFQNPEPWLSSLGRRGPRRGPCCENGARRH